MPLIGFISADGTSDQPEGHGHCSFDLALSESEKRDSTAFPIPYPILKGILDSNQERGDYLSATSILGCLRKEFLKRRTGYYAKPESLYAAFRGQLFHSLLEDHASPAARTEQKVIREFRGVEIGGTFDSCYIYDEDGFVVIDDWKTTKDFPRFGAPYTHHRQQVNIYRWLMGLDPKKVKLRITYFTMEGFATYTLRDGSQAKSGRGVSDIWSDQEVEEFLGNRLLVLRESLDSGIPLPYAKVSDGEKWECQYCPVRDKCESLRRMEEEQTFRRRAGLPPVEDVEWSQTAALTTEWKWVEEAVQERLSRAAPTTPVKPPAGKRKVAVHV